MSNIPGGRPPNQTDEEPDGYLGKPVEGLLLIDPHGRGHRELDTTGADDAARKSRTEKGSSDRKEWFEKFFLAYLCAFALVLLISIACLAAAKWEPHGYQDFLAYVFPCLAALSAGFSVYLENWGRTLFGFSGLLLAGGFAFYLAAHGHAGWLTGIIAVALLTFACVVTIEAFQELAETKGPMLRAIIFAGILLSTVSIIVVGAGILIDAIE